MIKSTGIIIFLLTLIANAKEYPVVQSKAGLVIQSRVMQWVATDTTNAPVPVWIYFTDKGFTDRNELPERLGKTGLSLRAQQRRAKVMSGPLQDFRDLPVHPEYIASLVSAGLEHRATSKWLNAVSGTVPREQLDIIAQYPYVREIRLLPTEQPVSIKEPSPDIPAPVEQVNSGFEYGPSFRQLQQINVPQVHARGYSGAGVLVCITDTGFLRDHEALDHVDVLAEFDFINRDEDTRDDYPTDVSGQQDHGSRVLSVLAGQSPGNLYGPAYNASFILAKTEDLPNESIVEEDYWVEAVEWAEGLGADIVNASIGYLDWYSYDDLDGVTSPMTIAADIAAAKGVLVCTSIGNQRNKSWYYLTVPADADSIISVGAVDSLGVLADFSSAGPTADGRTKPEIVAPGLLVYMIDPSTINDYTQSSGTSYASPLVAGVCALLLEAHPTWTPMQVREALMQTADRSDQPGNLYGWGLVNALAALEYQVKGDVDGNDRIDINDLWRAAELCLDPAVYSDTAQRAADLDGNGIVDIRDVVQLVRTLK